MVLHGFDLFFWLLGPICWLVQPVCFVCADTYAMEPDAKCYVKRNDDEEGESDENQGCVAEGPRSMQECSDHALWFRDHIRQEEPERFQAVVNHLQRGVAMFTQFSGIAQPEQQCLSME